MCAHTWRNSSGRPVRHPARHPTPATRSSDSLFTPASSASAGNLLRNHSEKLIQTLTPVLMMRFGCWFRMDLRLATSPISIFKRSRRSSRETRRPRGRPCYTHLRRARRIIASSESLTKAIALENLNCACAVHYSVNRRRRTDHLNRNVAYGEKCRRQIRNAKSIQCTA